MDVSQSTELNSDDQSRRILAEAALFDGSFSIDWLHELKDYKTSQLLLAVDDGVKSGLLIRHNSYTYDFSDPEERLALREELPAEDRELLNKRIINVLLRESPDEEIMTREITGQLLQIVNDLEGCRWLFNAGNAHRHAFRRTEAMKCFKKVLEDLDGLDSEEADWLHINASINFSKTSVAGDMNEEVTEALKKALKRAKARGDLINQVHIEHHLGKFAWHKAQYKKQLRHLERAEKLARGIDDLKFQRDLTIYNIIRLYGHGRYEEAAAQYYDFMPEIDRYPQGWFTKLAGISLGACLAFTGQTSHALGMLDGIRTNCRKMGNYSIAGEAGLAMGAILLDIRNLEAAISYLDEALKDTLSGQQMMAGVCVLLARAYAHYLADDIDNSIKCLNESIYMNRTVKYNTRPLTYNLHLAWAMAEDRYPRLYNMDIEDEIRFSINSSNLCEKGIAYRYRALLDQRKGKEHGSVLRSLNRSLDWLMKSGHKTETARTRLEIGRQYLTAGKGDKAREAVGQAAEYLNAKGNGLVPENLLHLIDDRGMEKNLLKEIFKLGRETVSIRDAKHLVQHIISTVNRITGAERGAIFLLDETGNDQRFILRATKNLTVEDIDSPGFARSMDIIRHTTATGEGCIETSDTITSYDIVSGKTIRSCICVPLILRDRVIGVLYHDNLVMDNCLEENDLEVTAYFAGLAAIAMDNANAYEEVRVLNQRLKEEKQYYEEQHLESVNYEDIVGKSEGIHDVLSRVKRSAPTDTTVLILGETGVGKELIARAIHRSSERRDKPFIRVHCSALPESLISSELFGHEKGAFTGAVNKRIGRFELADGGTLFLDEIGELPLEVQVRLLRVLQTREFERVGGSVTLRSDFRLIVATNRDLENAVRQKRFRQDLYYRIAVFPIVVPPLRDRREDIPLLAFYFLKIYSNKMGKRIEKIKQSQMEKLLEYDWPGNVRELENVIERGIILSSGTEFRAPELGKKITASTGDREIQTLKEGERQLIEQALLKTKGKVQGPGGAAEMLDINPNTLKSRMKKLGIVKGSLNV